MTTPSQQAFAELPAMEREDFLGIAYSYCSSHFCKIGDLCTPVPTPSRSPHSAVCEDSSFPHYLGEGAFITSPPNTPVEHSGAGQRIPFLCSAFYLCCMLRRVSFLLHFMNAMAACCSTTRFQSRVLLVSQAQLLPFSFPFPTHLCFSSHTCSVLLSLSPPAWCEGSCLLSPASPLLSYGVVFYRPSV